VDGAYPLSVFNFFSREWGEGVLPHGDKGQRHSLGRERVGLAQGVAGPDARAEGRQRPSVNLKGAQRVERGLRPEARAHLVHDAEQDGAIESFHRTLKKEHIWPYEFELFQDVERAIEVAFVDHNRNRVHFSLGYLTPSEFLEL
jgi:transposase InsO family protein